MQITTIVGNPKPRSKTFAFAEQTADQLHDILKRHTSAEVTHEVIDLADYASDLVQWKQETIQSLQAQVEASTYFVVASPTYKATYTGLLKLFMDLLPMNALVGKLAFPLMVGAGYQHQLAVEIHLKPLLAELGAICPGRGLYVLDTEEDRGRDAIKEWIRSAEPVMKSLL
ncbi:MAG: NAD(P)H-dependent oxidoreductase [Paenibacillaceae bacterium]|uniref:NAD(P)H-dependent oxidoreductase n=1 Tax=Paenibacillus mellifer TaxID=2937794 RepID=A0A9X2BRX2_9BACL|nr:NAD(P)H-dependent oxidoreductase [Paenibacillus mellifer]MBW4840691.1 NAD(P)H-dependent oxidoreductase [Paenibacillaceae bacterium]MCK8489888.1 NAD(P)H-dependent oxidoreductase [Paenibacillus mellifer]